LPTFSAGASGEDSQFYWVANHRLTIDRYRATLSRAAESRCAAIDSVAFDTTAIDTTAIDTAAIDTAAIDTAAIDTVATIVKFFFAGRTAFRNASLAQNLRRG
jgi:hypothetical protein